jgi:hypothetical protein
MNSWGGHNRRKFPRVDYPCQVVIRSADAAAVSIMTHTQNVGIGGISVILKQPVSVQTPVELDLDLMDLGEHLRCKGKVVWVIQRKESDETKPLFYDTGIEFVSPDPQVALRIQEIVNRLAEQNS